jgi:hypothetical protein
MIKAYTLNSNTVNARHAVSVIPDRMKNRGLVVLDKHDPVAKDGSDFSEK